MNQTDYTIIVFVIGSIVVWNLGDAIRNAVICHFAKRRADKAVLAAVEAANRR